MSPESNESNESQPDHCIAPSLGPRGVAVLLFGHKMYVEMTKKLALSMERHCPQIKRAVITDSEDPELSELFHHVLPHDPDFGYGVKQKLSMDRYAPFDETIFIDCDCLVFGDLDSAWDLFADVSVGLVGKSVTEGYWYTDIPPLLERTGLESIPEINTGLLYVRRDEMAHKVFERSRELIPQYEEFGFHPFRDHISDEPLISLAMAENGIKPAADNHDFYLTLENIYGAVSMDVLAGRMKCRLYDFETGSMRLTSCDANVAHFAGGNRKEWLYKREMWKLSLWKKRKNKPRLISWLVNTFTNFFYVPYAFCARLFKTIRVLNRRRPRFPYAVGFNWP